MDTIVIFCCVVLWLIGVCLTLTWVLKTWPLEEDPIETVGPAMMLCLFLWPVVLAGLAALTLAGKKLEREIKPEVKLCGCGSKSFQEWTTKGSLHPCCYDVTKERLKRREEKRKGMVC